MDGDAETALAHLLREVEGLRQAVVTRGDIGQGIGVMVGMFQTTPEVARSVLADAIAATGG